MRQEMLTQRAPFCIGAMAKKGMLSQHFMHVRTRCPLPFVFHQQGFLPLQ